MNRWFLARSPRLRAGLLMMLLVWPSLSAEAQSTGNIDLATVPPRDGVQLTIYNAEDLTLVRETRRVTFKPGINTMQFSWANTLIDPTSVELAFKGQADQLTLLDTTFPHDRPQVLYWNVASEFAGETQVEISYFTSGISWSADYTLTVPEVGGAASLAGYVTVSNQSGEDFEDAQVRLVVGKINLVEKIAQLAQQGMGGLQPRRSRQMALGMAVRRAERLDAMVSSQAPASPAMFLDEEVAKQVVKEGLSEYFIFTIEGTEDLPHTLRKRLESFASHEATLKTQYRYRPQQYGQSLVRFLLMKNDEESALGTSPLPDGVVRVFGRRGDEGLRYIGQQTIAYVPIGEDIELNMGADPRVILETTAIAQQRDNIVMQIRGANVFKRLDEPGVQIEARSTVAGWDERTLFEQRIVNTTSHAIELQIRRHQTGDADFISRGQPQRHDANAVQYTLTVEPGQEHRSRYELRVRQARNAKQNELKILDADPIQPFWEPR